MSTFHRDDATFAAITSGDITGTATNDNAGAGIVGEVIEGDLASGSATSLTTSVAKNITSVSLTAGDWDVSAAGFFIPAATTTTQFVLAGLSTTSATADGTNGRSTSVSYPAASAVLNTMSAPVMTCRFSFASTTTVFLVGLSSFATSTMTAYGHILARRAR